MYFRFRDLQKIWFWMKGRLPLLGSLELAHKNYVPCIFNGFQRLRKVIELNQTTGAIINTVTFTCACSTTVMFFWPPSEWTWLALPTVFLMPKNKSFKRCYLQKFSRIAFILVPPKDNSDTCIPLDILYTCAQETILATACDFLQCGMLTSVYSYEPVQPPFNCAYAQADLRLLVVALIP